jgi:hypothetical protein
MWTWAQLGFHQKPLGLLGAQNFFAPLLQFLDVLVAQRFLRPEHRQLPFVEQDPIRLLQLLAGYTAPIVSKWIDRDEA